MSNLLGDELKKLQEQQLSSNLPVSQAEYEKTEVEINLWDEEKFSFDDKGNGDRFAALYSNDLKYCPATKQWYEYVGTHWKRQHHEVALNYVKRMVDTLRRNLPPGLDLMEEARAKRIIGFSRKVGTRLTCEDTLKMARGHESIALDESAFDRQLGKLNVANGTIDLSTGTLHPHDRADLFTTICPVSFNDTVIGDTSQCLNWMNFLGDISGSDDDGFRMYLQALFGYAITGYTTEQKVFVLYGPGANGKSTLLGVIQDILGGGISQTATGNLLIKTRYESPAQATGYIKRLKGKRLVLVSESKEGQHWDEALVKRITGNEVVTARDLYEKEIEFKPTHKLLVDTNYVPLIDGVDNGIKRRVVIVPFTVTFSAAQMDRNLRAKLEKEHEGILSWLVRGAVEWFNLSEGGTLSGLPACDRIAAATHGFLEDSDDVAQFLDEMCVRDSSARVELRALNDQYTVFRTMNGSDYKSTTRSFAVKIRTHGYQMNKSNSKQFVLGVRLKNSAFESVPISSEDFDTISFVQ